MLQYLLKNRKDLESVRAKLACPCSDKEYQKEASQKHQAFRESVKDFNDALISPTNQVLDFAPNCFIQSDWAGTILEDALGSVPFIMAQTILFFAPQMLASAKNKDKLRIVYDAMASHRYFANNADSSSALDVLMPLKYGINTTIPESVADIINAIYNSKPIVVLVDREWQHADSLADSDKEQAMIIWGLEYGSFVLTDTYHEDSFTAKVTDFIPHLHKAWILSKM